VGGLGGLGGPTSLRTAALRDNLRAVSETSFGLPPPQENASSSEASLGLQLAHYFRIVRKRWLVSSITILIVVGGVAVWTYRQPKFYEATCSVVIDPMAPQVLHGVKEVIELGTGNYWANREFYETQYRIIRSKEIAQHAADRLGLASDPNYPSPGAGKGKSGRDVSGMVMGAIRVSPVKDSRIANITVRDRDPKRAADLANAIAQAYIEKNLDHKLEGSKEAAVWLGDQVSGLMERLRQSEIALHEYRRNKQLLDVNLDDRQSMTSENVRTYNQRLTDIRAKRIELESIRKLILDARNDIEEQESLREVQDNRIVQQLRINYLELLRSKAELETKYGPRHPRIEGLERQIAAIKKDYSDEVGKIVRAYEKAYQALIESEKSLAKLIESEKRQAIDLAKLEIEYRPLSREAENNQRLLTQLTQREKEASLSGLMRTNNVRILDLALPIPKPVVPRPLVNMGMALALGLVLGLGLAVSLEALDNTVKSQEQAEALLGVPVLGVIPLIGDAGAERKKLSPAIQRERDLSILHNPKSSVAEACRSIRTNLLFLSPEKRTRSIVITSPGPQEGKTTTAINLAVTIAQAGAKILLVDTDMRRPRLHQAFEIESRRGASNVIVGDATLDETIVRSSVPNLDLLPCGPTPPNPAELLHTSRFAELMAECALRYDWVIYDSPPTSAVTDPAIIGNLADGVILVARAGHTSKEAAISARRQLASARAKLLGSIVNRVDFSDRSYGYYYSRYYRAYGGYYSQERAKA
jgi:polysaccharide biosynthesis transport protein